MARPACRGTESTQCIAQRWEGPAGTREAPVSESFLRPAGGASVGLADRGQLGCGKSLDLVQQPVLAGFVALAGTAEMNAAKTWVLAHF